MSRITKPLFIAVMLVMPLAAQATTSTVVNTYSWQFSDSSSNTNCINCPVSSDDANFYDGNSYKFGEQRPTDGDGNSSTSNNVTVTGFSTTNDLTAPGVKELSSDTTLDGFETATVKMWNGLGVSGQEDGTTSVVPQHAMDNNGYTTNETLDSGDTDAALFSFDQAINLNSITIGWEQTDADVSVLAYTRKDSNGNIIPSLPAIPNPIATSTHSCTTLPCTTTNVTNTNTYTTLLQNGWEFVGHYNLSGNTNTATNGNAAYNIKNNITTPSGLSSSYWLISAYSSFADGDGSSNTAVASKTFGAVDFGNDYFKLAGLGGTITTTTTTQVPEPTSLVLLALGLFGWRMARNTLGLADLSLSTSSMAA
ncbi:MAG: PEP-CTERM sorting domain-containing protein [Methylovulum sp.]|nr:PEP-CTERM sorting domain-containing protein [Methylovulum sp.]